METLFSKVYWNLNALSLKKNFRIRPMTLKSWITFRECPAVFDTPATKSFRKLYLGNKLVQTFLSCMLGCILKLLLHLTLQLLGFRLLHRIG